MSDCIEWTGGRQPKGYGNRYYCGRNHGAHRVTYVEAHGLQMSDIQGMHVMHTCDNPPCVNPDHLRLGTNQDNIDDKVAKGRTAKRLKPRKYSDALIVEAVRLRESGKLLREVSELTGIPTPYLSKLFRGKRGAGRQLRIPS